MNQIQANVSAPIARHLYLFSVLVLGLTGFAQMPIFKRYYIADIPGLGWLAQFYVTHYLHYLAAILLLAVAAYFIVDFLAVSGRRLSLSPSGYVRAVMLAALIVSGIFLVIRNLEGLQLGSGFIIFLDLFHMGMVIALIVTSIYCLLRGKRWIS